jgi:type VI secretion system secreted protein VgrG
MSDPTNVADSDAVGDSLQLNVASGVCAIVILGDSVSVKEGDSVTVTDGESLNVGEGDSVTVIEGESVGVTEGDSIAVTEGDSVTVTDGVSTRVGESVGVTEGDSIGVESGECVGVCEAGGFSVGTGRQAIGFGVGRGLGCGGTRQFAQTERSSETKSMMLGLGQSPINPYTLVVPEKSGTVPEVQTPLPMYRFPPFFVSKMPLILKHV